jgi:hypothetical protein
MSPGCSSAGASSRAAVVMKLTKDPDAWAKR